MGVVFDVNNKVLLSQRNQPQTPYAHDKWQFPGGGMEFGEDPIETVKREVKEETGIDIELLSEKPVLHSSNLSMPEEDIHLVVLGFPARYVSIGENIKLSKRNKRVGQEVVGTLSNIDLPNIFNREENVLDLLKYISKKSNFNVIGQISRSDHENIDAAVILSESHFSIHYNQQTNEVKVDIFTCGKEGDPNKGYELLKNEIRAQESNRIYLKR